MSLAETQRVASAVSLRPVVNGAPSCSAASECELQGTQKRRNRVSTFHNGPSPLSLKKNGWERLGFQSQE